MSRIPKVLLLLIGLSPFPGLLGQDIDLPYLEAGLTREQAAAHLLNRFAYGPQPDQVEALTQIGLAYWVEQQLNTAFDDEALEKRLHSEYSTLELSLAEISQRYPSPPVRAIFMASTARRRGRNLDQMRERMQDMRKDSEKGDMQGSVIDNILYVKRDSSVQYDRIQRFIEQRFGFKPFNDLMFQAMGQKVERATYNPNQLEEVLTDFWFNHFNVSLTRLVVAPHILAYERDAIRPHVLGNFRDLLGATAHHPAMLYYLDNHKSNAAADAPTLAPPREEAMRNVYEDIAGKAMEDQLKQVAQQPGINENYARELLELHTMGVDGGYTQKDVQEVARVFTGWKASPFLFPLAEEARRKIERSLFGQEGVILEDGFLFDPSRHDAGEKAILGTTFPAGGGVEEGEQVLDMLATHPSTARFISHKLAQRFVSDDPPEELVEAMAATFLETEGNIKAVMITLVESKAFWQPAALAAKIKTPLELVVSAVRSLDAEIQDPVELIRWCTRMGQPLYAYQAPTGYPEEAAPWTNGAALLNRMNFALGLSRQLEGLQLDLLALNDHHEPASAEDALSTYLPILLPGRDTVETRELLLPAIHDPQFEEKLAQQVAQKQKKSPDQLPPAEPTGGASLSQVVGLILGSPEFQRQ